MEVINALGRRKTAVARVYLSDGDGKIVVNKRDYKEFFSTAILHYVVEQPLQLTDNLGNSETGKYLFDLMKSPRGNGRRELSTRLSTASVEKHGSLCSTAFF